jgi:PAS domain S-box-containing protein
MTSASASPTALIVRDAPLPVTDLSPYLSIYEDPSAQLGIEGAMSDTARFVPNTQAVPSFGFTGAAVWVRFDVRSESNDAQSLRVELGTPRLSHAAWYVVADGALEETKPCGSADRAREPERLPALDFLLPAGAVRTVYLRAESETAIWLPLRAGAASLIHRLTLREEAKAFLLLGFCVALALISLLLGVVQRQRLYVYFAAVTVAYALYFVFFHGYLIDLLPRLPAWLGRQGVGIAAGFGLLFFSLFNGSFLGGSGLHRRERWLQRAALTLAVASMVAFLVLDFVAAMKLFYPLGFLCVLAGAALVIGRGRRLARADEIWFGAAWLAIGLLVVFMGLQFTGSLPVLVSFGTLQLFILPSFLTAFLLAILVRQRAEQAEQLRRDTLRAAERQAHEVIGNIAAGTYEVSLDKDAQGVVGPHFRFVSLQFLEMFGLEREALLADPSIILSRIHPEDAARLNAANAEAYETGDAFRWEGRVVVGEKVRSFVAVSTPRKNLDGLTVWSGVVTDVTDRVEAEQKLAKALEAKGQFLAKMSHEIRTPLSALVSLAQAMWMRGEKQQLDPDFTQFLNRVRSGGQYLNLLLRNVLNFSAAESGRVPVKASEFYVADWVGEIRNILEPIAEYHRSRIEWTMPSDDEARFRTDQMRLTQIALNLGENALKFSAGGDAPVHIAVDKIGDRLLLVVEDRGPGIPPDMTKAVFEEFSQAGTEVSPLDEGVGLGLAVVKINTDLLGGTVRVQAAEPHGTRFLVEIPEMLKEKEDRPPMEEDSRG